MYAKEVQAITAVCSSLDADHLITDLCGQEAGYSTLDSGHTYLARKQSTLDAGHPTVIHSVIDR